MHTNLYAACILSLVPLRAEAAHRSEMVSQLLFGECFEIIEQKEGWARIHSYLDAYEGWIQEGQFKQLSYAEYSSWINSPKVLVGPQGAQAVYADRLIQLIHGTWIPEHQGLIQLGSQEYQVMGDFIQPNSEAFPHEIQEIAQLYHQVPYLWGGRSSYGIDCSGFSQLIYRHFNYVLPRDAYQQAELGETVNFITEAQAGDLAYFDNQEGRITHVGIMLDQQLIIHASASIRIDPIDATGIFNKELNRYTHQLRIIKRYRVNS